MKNTVYRLFTITTDNGGTLYAVNIRHYSHTAFLVFSDAETRAEYMKKELATMEKLRAPLRHDSTLQPPAGLLKEYQNSRGLFSKIESRQIYKTF